MRIHNRHGVAAVEMALIAPFLFLVIFGAIELSRMMMVRQSLTNTARESCRLATLATTQSNQTVTDFARNKLVGVIPESEVSTSVLVSIDPSINGVESGSEITIELAVDCEDVSWLPPFLFSGSKIQSSARMVRQ